MKNFSKCLVVMLLAFSATGCAKFWDEAEAQGGVFSSSKAPYIIVNESGGIIMDVYKLQDAIVQSPQGSDGWLFLDDSGRPVYLGGDVQTMRLKSTADPIWNKYFEYHYLTETKTYHEKFGAKLVQ